MRVKMLLGGLASMGALETGYLSVSKMLQNNALVEKFCGVGSCVDVLNSPYATVPGINIPLTSIGFAGYLTVATLSFLPDFVKLKEENSSIKSKWKDNLLLIIPASMATFISAVLSTSMFFTSWNGRFVSNRTTATVLSSMSIMITTIASFFLFYITSMDVSQASTAPAAQYLQRSESEKNQSPKSPPAITTESSPQAIELSGRLNQLDAKMYGAYWCSHCFNQKQQFGKDAFANIPYIECDKKGEQSQFSLCREKKIPGYPTWEIKGKLYPGEKTLEEISSILLRLEKE